MDEINQGRVSVSIHAVAAIIMGWLSVQIASMSRALFAVALGLVILYIVGFVTQKIVGKKGIKWWFGNGIIIYLFIWYITWVFLFNLPL